MTPASAHDVITAAIVGASVGPVAHEVDARWLMAYAAALDERDGRYFDTASARGPCAHPLFAACYEWPVAVALRERVVPAPLLALGVHATHDLTIHRAPRAGERLHTTGRVTAVQARRSGALVVCRFETVDCAGAPVTTTDYGSVYRGVPAIGAGAAPEVPRPAGDTGEADRWRQPVEVGACAAWVYTECARIWNPIHTDVAVARGAGLPAPILHGTATLALAVSRVLDHDLGGDPAVVSGVSARFTGMVAMPSTLVVRGGPRDADRIGFDVLNEAGSPVVAAGLLRLCPVAPSSSEEPERCSR